MLFSLNHRYRTPPKRPPSPRLAHLPLGVAEDDGLRDGQGVVQITQSVELPLFSLHGNKELFDPLQRELITKGHKCIYIYIIHVS